MWSVDAEDICGTLSIVDKLYSVLLILACIRIIVTLAYTNLVTTTDTTIILGYYTIDTGRMRSNFI